MRFLDYVKDKLLFLSVSTVLLVFMGFSLELLHVDKGSRLYLLLVLFFALSLVFWVEFFMKAHFYNDVCKKLSRLDKKYLLSELINRPSLNECRILYEVLKTASKSMNDEIAVAAPMNIGSTLKPGFTRSRPPLLQPSLSSKIIRHL